MSARLQVVGTYVVPLLVGTAITSSVEDWDVGYYGHAAQVVGGPVLGIAILISAAVSQIGMFEAEMSSDSYQVLGMAERGYLPRRFAARSRFGTPVIGIALSSMGVVSMLIFSFTEIVAMLNAAYCLAELLEFAAFVWLRVQRPELHRSFKCGSAHATQTCILKALFFACLHSLVAASTCMWGLFL